MKILKHFKVFSHLTLFERTLWIVSAAVVTASFLLSPHKDYLSLTASLIGVTALIFVAKGYVLGQILTVVFSVFYGIISIYFGYYGEAITYLLMTTPVAVAAIISWVRNPYKGTIEVKVARLSKKQILWLTISSALVTALFYFLLDKLGTKNMLPSTISVTTSFVACYLTVARSPYYAIGYSANDIVLIVLWIAASYENIGYLPMVFCFVMFLVNDLYGFINWKRIERKQRKVDFFENL